MKILQICNKVPFPPKDGGCIAMNNLTQGLIYEGHQVKVLAINTPKHFVNIENLPSEYLTKTNIETVFIDTSIKPLSAFINLFSDKSYNISRFYSKEFEQKIIDLLTRNKYDVIQLESLFVSMYVSVIRKYSNAKIVLRAHNVEHKIWERNAENQENILKKKYLTLLAKRLKTYELSVLSSFDGIAAITKEDAQWFVNQEINIPVNVVPFGIDLKQLESEKNIEADLYSIFHIGAMDWKPNIDGISWFLNNVWNKVHEQHPDLKLYLAGRKLGDEFSKWSSKNVIAVGEVENAYEFMRSKGLMIVPLLSGGGMRVKIIEGMAMEKTIVTTTVGAEGIDCENNKNIIIANDPEGFVNAINRYISDREFLNSIGINAGKLAVSHYNNAEISKQLIAFYLSI